jgi:hypothetical protein
MVTPLSHPVADSSLKMKTTPGGMSLTLSRPPTHEDRLRWDFNFLLLLQFRDREGHVKVPRLHVEDGRKLGNWIYNQRKRKKIGTIRPEHERRLNEVGFIWKPLEEKWDMMGLGR